MPSTVYKGDLAEVAFAPETGLTIYGHDATITLGATANQNDVTTITFSAEVNMTLFEEDNDKLKYPKNILVGSQLVFNKGSSGNLNDADRASEGAVFTIVENDGVTLKFTPAAKTTGALHSSDSMTILPYKTVPMDTANHTRHADDTSAPSESALIDQFLGITTALTLPETKVDLKRYHVVGLGRDASVLAPGKFTTEGGSFEVAMHSARWLKYCLGQEIMHFTGSASDTTSTLNADARAGQSFIEVASADGFAVGKYVQILETATVPIVSDHEPDGGTWNGSISGDYDFDKATVVEVRRIIGVKEGGERIYLDEPLTYNFATGKTVEVHEYGTPGTNPPTIGATGTITDPVNHLIYSRSTVPSFCMEVSHRRRDVDSTTGPDGGAGDSKELTRIYRGCKVTDFTLTTDNDAALRLNVNYNAALVYTDTGRIDTVGNSSRYNPHRMFDDTASTDTDRLKSGIGVFTQKPFMFYNGSIRMAGVQIGQIQSFTLSGSNGMQAFHTLNGSTQASSTATSQVPFGGSRNTSVMVEGQTTYDLSMEIIVDDPIFYHEMRSANFFSVNEEGSTDNQIRIDFVKQQTGSTASADLERLTVLIDDYYITEAPLQIPEDKGPVRSSLKVVPKAIKVLARDTILKY